MLGLRHELKHVNFMLLLVEGRWKGLIFRFLPLCDLRFGNFLFPQKEYPMSFSSFVQGKTICQPIHILFGFFDIAQLFVACVFFVEEKHF